jgi:restriction endonuclease S subunit
MKRQRASLGEICSLVKGTSPISKTLPGPYTLVTTGETHKTADSFQLEGEAVCIPLISSTGHGHASLKRVHYISGKFALANLLAAAIVKDHSVLSAKYLTRYLMFNKDRLIVPLMTGAANMSISLDRLATVPIEFPPLTEQKRIVKLLDEADEVRKLRAQADNRTTNFVSALFHKMFGDPGSNSQGWLKTRLGDVVLSTEQRNPSDKPAAEFIYADIASIDNKTKAITTSTRLRGADAPSRARKVIRKGDVIVSMVRPNLNAVALVPASMDNQICSTGFSVLRPMEKVTSDYIFGFVRSQFFINHLVARTTGANYPAVGDGEVKDVPLLLPPLALQKEFAERVKEIREIEAAQATSRTRLDALFQSMLHRAFNGLL